MKWDAVEEEDAQRQICRKPGFGASGPDGTALMAFGTVCCMQKSASQERTLGRKLIRFGAFSRCTQELPPGSDHGLGPEIGLLHTL